MFMQKHTGKKAGTFCLQVSCVALGSGGQRGFVYGDAVSRIGSSPGEN